MLACMGRPVEAAHATVATAQWRACNQTSLRPRISTFRLVSICFLLECRRRPCWSCTMSSCASCRATAATGQLRQQAAEGDRAGTRLLASSMICKLCFDWAAEEPRKGAAGRVLHPTIFTSAPHRAGLSTPDRPFGLKVGCREFRGDAGFLHSAAGACPVELCGCEPPAGSGTNGCGARCPVSAKWPPRGPTHVVPALNPALAGRQRPTAPALASHCRLRELAMPCQPSASTVGSQCLTSIHSR